MDDSECCSFELKEMTEERWAALKSLAEKNILTYNKQNWDGEEVIYVELTKTFIDDCLSGRITSADFE
jgi:hypothetical protein